MTRALTVGLFALAVGALAGEGVSMEHLPPERADARTPLRVEGTLGEVPDLDHVDIRFRGPAGDFTLAPMEQQYGDLYRGYIPAWAMVPPGVEYYIEAVMKSGKRLALCFSAERPTRVYVFEPDAGPSATGPPDGGPSTKPAKKP